MTTYTWQSAGLTSRGLVRPDNQDSFHISEDGRLFVVADGVGGYGGGAIASRLAVQTLEEGWKVGSELDGDDVESWMRKTVTEANRRIIQGAQSDSALENMGTTIVTAVIDRSGSLHVGHAGDSRAVLIRNDELKMLTIDHSMVMEMHLAGQLTLEEARNNIYKHLITRCLGHDEDVEIDYSKCDFLPGDCIVLASDGLSDEMAEADISAAVRECYGAEEVCKKLMDTVLQRGARDNTTIIAVKRSHVAVQKS